MLHDTTVLHSALLLFINAHREACMLYCMLYCMLQYSLHDHVLRCSIKSCFLEVASIVRHPKTAWLHGTILLSHGMYHTSQGACMNTIPRHAAWYHSMILLCYHAVHYLMLGWAVLGTVPSRPRSDCSVYPQFLSFSASGARVAAPGQPGSARNAVGLVVLASVVDSEG
jgi:hypothetical protein